VHGFVLGSRRRGYLLGVRASGILRSGFGARELSLQLPRLAVVWMEARRGPVIPGLAISLAVLAFNLVGDRMRDVLDPRLRSVGKF
jgi:hypothetical protein